MVRLKNAILINHVNRTRTTQADIPSTTAPPLPNDFPNCGSLHQPSRGPDERGAIQNADRWMASMTATLPVSRLRYLLSGTYF
jgi:hypothetical protein